MRAIFGLLLVMLGLAMAVIWMPEQQGERQLAVVTEIATKGIALNGARVPAADDRSGRTFSPHTPLLATVEAPGSRASHTVAVARVGLSEQSLQRTLPAATAMPTSSYFESTVAAIPLVRPGEPVQPRGLPVPEMSRDELVRSIQRELKRVGSYSADVDGDWGTGSRRAMVNFTDRVNASLPVDQPDFILLTLLRGHSGTVCGKGCPTGQTLGEYGRCLPIAVQARRSVEPRVAAARPSVGYDQPAPIASSQWSTNVVTAAPLRNADPAPAGQPSSAQPSISAGSAIGLAAATAATSAAGAMSPSPQPPAPSWRMAVGGPRNGGGSAYVIDPLERTPARGYSAHRRRNICSRGASRPARAWPPCRWNFPPARAQRRPVRLPLRPDTLRWSLPVGPPSVLLGCTSSPLVAQLDGIVLRKSLIAEAAGNQDCPREPRRGRGERSHTRSLWG